MERRLAVAADRRATPASLQPERTDQDRGSRGTLPESASGDVAEEDGYVTGDADSPPPLDEEADGAMQRERGDREPDLPVSEEPDSTEPLPPVESLLEQIPPEAREVLDELFRARFTAVRRIPAGALKKSGS